MNFEDLAPELQEKVKACKTPEEILALAQEEGYELSDESLEAISGGEWRGNVKLRMCHSKLAYPAR